jgi:glycosyltransferase involved in cell wall biosynthesis
MRFLPRLRRRLQQRLANRTLVEITAIALSLPLWLIIRVKVYCKAWRVGAVPEPHNARAQLMALCAKPSIDAKDNAPYTMSDAVLDLSIIMPIYNAESFLAQTLNSVLKQNTTVNFELICINDGSTDSSADILDSYKAHPCVRVVATANSGISAARNLGLTHARGRFIMFLDSDDLLLSGAVDVLMQQAMSSGDDIVCGSFKTFSHTYDDTQQPLALFKRFAATELDKHIADGFPWGKVYKRELWQNIRFPVGYHFEDTIINALVFRRAKMVSLTQYNVVAYRQHQASATKILNESARMGIYVLWCVEMIIEENRRLNMPNDDQFNKILVNQLTTLLVSRTRNVKLHDLKYIFSWSAFLAANVEISVTGTDYSTLAFKALLNKDFNNWYFYSLLSII